DLDALIEPLSAAGGTSLAPALDAAYAALLNVDAPIKHVLLLSDGHSLPDELEPLVRRMRSAGMTLSTLAVGDAADQPLMRTLADQGGGRAYFCTRPDAIPQLILQDTALMTEAVIDESPFRPTVEKAPPWLEQIKVADAPLLYGFVKSRAKPGSEVLLRTPTEEPLWAHWPIGAGRVVAFTSDAKPRWSKDWFDWPDFGAFWAQTLRRVAMPAGDDRCQLLVDRQRTEVHVTVDLTDGQGGFNSDARLQLETGRADDSRGQQPMGLVGPGRYEATLPADDQALQFTVTEWGGGTSRILQRRSLPSTYPEEWRLGPVETARLQAIAYVSGGEFDPAATDESRGGSRAADRSQTLAPALLALCLGLFLADLLVRSHRTRREFASPRD
ncbi:MAG: VWA domain-containing protein, partial [Planctomycetota bacterium]